jgi:hypothetical protein
LFILVNPAVGDTELEALDAVDVPLAFVAVTVKVYEVPLIKPVTVIGDEAPDAVMLLGEDVTVYEVIADPPVAPAVNATEICPPTPVSVTAPIVGACGTVVAVTPVDADEAEDAPVLLLAETVYVY